jgi:phosphate uptake regulator
MPRERFESELQKLQANVLELGHTAEKAVLDSVEALRVQDLEAAQKIIADDKFINERRFAMENDVITLIATQQPMVWPTGRSLRSSPRSLGGSWMWRRPSRPSLLRCTRRSAGRSP